MNQEHCVVIGAGIIGISSAYYLSKRGYKVTVIERGDIGNGASFGSAGIVAVGHPTMPRPGLVSQTLKWMLNRTSPIQIKRVIIFTFLIGISVVGIAFLPFPWNLSLIGLIVPLKKIFSKIFRKIK